MPVGVGLVQCADMGEHKHLVRRRSIAGIAIAVSLAVAVSCIPPELALLARAAWPVAAECGVADSFSCNLPYPSDRWLVEDASTATGVRLEIPTDVVPENVRSAFGDYDVLADAMVNADGFSPVTPMAWQLPEGLARDAVPADGGELIQVWDATTGERVRVNVEVSNLQTDERGVHNIIVAYPATRFEPGHRIFGGVVTGVAAVTGGLASASGSKAWASDATRNAAAQVTPGIPWDQYLAATSFTVRSDESFTTDVDRMVGLIEAADHPMRNLSVSPPVLGGALLVSGQIRSLDFRGEYGAIPRDGSAVGKERWLDFLLVLPQRPATAQGAPVIVYSHGLIASKETMLVVADQNARKGFATIAIDKPNHGSRLQGGPIYDLIWPRNLPRVQSLLLQAVLDDVSLIQAVKQHGAELDQYPANPVRGNGDGTPDLNPDHLYFAGTSLGGVLGAAAVGLAPDIDGAYFQVPGSGIIDTLFHSLAWDLFHTLVPSAADYGDAHVLTFFAQTLLDRADNTHYLGRIRERGIPMFLSYAIDDGLVRNQSTERMAEILGLPMVGDQRGPIPERLTQGALATMPADGRGFGQIPTQQIPDTLLKRLLTHVQFIDPISVSMLDDWLDGRLAEIRSEG